MKKMTLTTAALTAMIALSTTTSVFAADPITTPTTGTVNVTAANDANGDLKLVNVPNIDFGDVKVGTKKAPMKTADKNITVSDLRATGAGWTLTVNYGDGNGAAVTSNDAWKGTNGNGSGFKMGLSALKYSATTEDTNVGNAPSVNAGVDEINETAKPVETAAADKAEGLGVWDGSLESDATTITIPANNIAQQYTAQLVWTLNDAPIA